MSGGGGGFIPNAQSAVAGPITQFTGAAQVANAQGQMANAQLGQQQSDRAQAMALMAPTQAEMQQLQQALSVNNQQIQQNQQLLGSIDPAIMSLLGGGSAPMLAPIQNQRAQQRAQLQQQLESQLGPGYAASTAGIQALNNFDQQTSNVMTQAQQSALSQYGGLEGQFAGQQQQGISNLSALTGQQYGWQQGQAGALMGTPVNPGLAYSGQLANAQAQSMFGLSPLMGPMTGVQNMMSQQAGINNQNAQANYYNSKATAGQSASAAPEAMSTYY